MILDSATAAHAAGVTERTIRRWVRSGVLRNHGTDRRLLVHLDDVDTARTRRAIHRSGVLDMVSATV
ncbi:MAG: hypothetical protein GEU78_09495 [Actinobacteria bacterium]|nr:hypothetical protein [Actinomycetota bacterium]